MKLFEPEKIDSLEAMIAITGFLKTYEALKGLKISKHALIHAQIVTLAQTVVEAKDLDTLFKNKVMGDSEFESINKLTQKTVELIESYLSETLESR